MKIKQGSLRRLTAGVVLGAFAGALSMAAMAADPVKIGFLVKQPEEPWFRDEWKFAEQAAKDKGFTLVPIGATDGEKVLTAIDNLAAQKAQGFVICVPDVKLGPAVVDRANKKGLKLMTVDDRLVDGTGKPIESVPHMGISAFEIGKQVGEYMVAEMKKRGWNFKDVGALRIAYDQLPTAKDRTDGAIAALKAAGFPESNIISAPQAKTDTDAAFTAANNALTQNLHKYKHWLAFGLNDEAVLGAVRAAEGRKIGAENVIGVGIGGSESALNEFKKSKPTGFMATILISPKRHGYETATNMYEWITTGKEPQKLTLTSGKAMDRTNYSAVRKEMGVE